MAPRAILYPTRFDAADAQAPSVDCWAQPWLPPVRRKTTPNGGTIVDAINTDAPPPPDVYADAWHNTWGEPKRRTPTPNGSVIAAIDTTVPTVDGWTQSLAIPIRRKTTPNGSIVDRVAFDSPVPAPEQSWFQPWLPPTRRPPRPNGVVVNAVNFSTPLVSGWFQAFGIPVRRKTRRLGQIVDRIDPTVPPTLSQGYFRPFSEPVRFDRHPQHSVALAASGSVWVTTGAYEPTPEELMLEDQRSGFVYTAEIHPWLLVERV